MIVHEYGHSVQDGQVPGFGTNLESGSIGEAFSDYLAVVVTSWATGAPTLTPEACVADWDSVSYTRTVAALPAPDRRHQGTTRPTWWARCTRDGEIWSRALWDIRTALGDTKASTLIVDAQFDFAPSTPRFRDAALRHRGRRAAALRQPGRGHRDPGGVRRPRHPLTGGAVRPGAGRDGAHGSDERATGTSKYVSGYGSSR